MTEFIRHALGLCGEHSHPNIFTLLFGGSTIGLGLKYYWAKFKTKIKSLKNHDN